MPSQKKASKKNATRKNATSATKDATKQPEVLIFPGLNEKESHAVELMTSGLSFKQVSQTMQIDRVTLYRWRKKAAFQNAIKTRLDDEDGDLLIEARITARMARQALRSAFEGKNPDSALALRYLERTGLLYVTDEQADREKAIQEAMNTMAGILTKHGIDSVN
jgi:hypothetical protein